MTWIKPSFLWMAYRCGWASKPGQERVLAIEISREGFEWALGNSCLSHFDPGIHTSEDGWRQQLAESPVRIQWDPERDELLRPLPHRSVQIGLGPAAVERYVTEWTRSIRDVTDVFVQAGTHAATGDAAAVAEVRPQERLYPLGMALASRLAATNFAGTG